MLKTDEFLVPPWTCFYGDGQLKSNVSWEVLWWNSTTCFVLISYVCRSAPEPQYTILREPVEGELPEFLVMEVQLPGIVSLSSGSCSLRIGSLDHSTTRNPAPHSQAFVDWITRFTQQKLAWVCVILMVMGRGCSRESFSVWEFVVTVQSILQLNKMRSGS